MLNTIYGGIQFPVGWQIDAIHYGSFQDLKDNIGLTPEVENVMLGRYILIKYSDKTYTYEELSDPDENIVNEEWKSNYNIDLANQNGMCDGLIVKKIAKKIESGVQISYAEITKLSFSGSLAQIKWEEFSNPEGGTN